MIVLRIKIWRHQNHFWKGYKFQFLNIKSIIIIMNNNNNNNYYYYYYYYNCVIFSNYIKRIITRCSLYKNLNGMIIMLVPTDKGRKVGCVLNVTEMLSTKATTKKNKMPSPTLSRKQLTIIFQKKRQNT